MKRDSGCGRNFANQIFFSMAKIVQYSDSESDEDSSQFSQIKDSQLNYFGLNPTNNNLAEEKDEDLISNFCPMSKKQRTIDKDFTVSVSGQNVSLPSVDFWKRISADEMGNSQQFSDHFVGTEYMANTASEETSPSCLKSSNSIPTLVTDKTKEVNCQSSLKFATVPLQIIKPYAKAAQNVTNKDNSSSKPIDRNSARKPVPDPQRKIYFIHGKVSSHLAHKQKCQPMKTRESLIAAHAGVINRIQWSSAQFSHLLLSASMDTLVKVWNVWSTLEPCVQILRHHSRAVKDAEWSISGRQILTCGYDRKAIIADVESGTMLHIFDHSDYVSCARYHPVNPHLLLTSKPNVLYTWDTRTPQDPILEYSYKDKLGTIQDLLFSRDGDKIFSCCDIVSRDSADRNIMAWDFKTGVILSNQIYHEKYTCSRLRHHPSENHFLAQSQGGYIAIFSASLPFKMNKSKRFEKHKLLGYKIGFDVSADGSLVTTGSSDGMMYTYNFHSGKMVNFVKTEMGVTLDVTCHPILSSTYACCSWDGQIQVWH